MKVEAVEATLLRTLGAFRGLVIKLHDSRSYKCKAPMELGWVEAVQARVEEYKRASAPECLRLVRERVREIAEHVARGGNVGLAVARGVLVLDADTPEAVEWLEARLPDAPCQLTKNGRHYWSRLPSGIEVPAASPVEVDGIKIDLRTEKSQLVVEPSRRPEKGQPYQWIPERTLALARKVAALPETPAAVMEAIALKSTKSTQSVQRNQERMDKGEPAPRRRNPILEGERHHKLVGTGAAMHARGESIETTAKSCSGWRARTACRPTPSKTCSASSAGSPAGPHDQMRPIPPLTTRRGRHRAGALIEERGWPQ